MKKIKEIRMQIVLALFLITSLVITYMAFDFYLKMAGEEIANGLLKTETIQIQQGNLISILSKNQRFLFSSKFVKGIELYDIQTGQSHISLGEGFDFKVPSQLPGENELLSKRMGFLHSQIFYFFKDKGLLLVFEIKSGFLAKFFYLFAGILSALSGVFFIVIRLIQKDEEAKRLDAIRQVGRQLRHDISSAMSTVVTIAETCEELPNEDKRSLLSFYQRVKTILSDDNFNKKGPLPKSKDRSKKKVPLNFTALIKDVYNEAVVKNRNREKIKWKLGLPHDCLDLCLEQENPGLSRCLHNLIDNATESIKGKGKVTLSLQRDQKEMILKIHDTGVGISPGDLKKVGTDKFTSKDGGEGLGVPHAKECIEKLGGTITFESIPNEGTTVILKLSYHPSPEVYRLEESFFEYPTYILVDDDPSVHQRAPKSTLWKDKNANIKCYFSFPERFTKGHGVFFLIDYDLKDDSTNGIDLIKRHNLRDKALLVTGHYNDPELVGQCMQEGIRILPKILL